MLLPSIILLQLSTLRPIVRGKHCSDQAGITYLPANHILSKSDEAETISGPSSCAIPQKKRELLVPSEKLFSGCFFGEGDRVTVYDCNNKIHIGTVKWAYPGKEKGIDGYIIGVELVSIIRIPTNIYTYILLSYVLCFTI